jgi:tetratricopeptide (TPR) repeat protein
MGSEAVEGVPARDAPAADGPGASCPPWKGAVALLVLVALAYSRALGCGWVWDDDVHVTDNPVLRAPGGLWDIWFSPRSLPQWYPVVHTTFWIEDGLWGASPAGHHLVNVLLHAVNALLLWKVLRRLEVPGAWLGAALFALHPVHVESVAWVSERKNVLSAAFALGSLLLLLRWAGLAGGRPGEGDRKVLGVAFALFVLALLSKSVVATLPAVLLVILWWKGKSITKRYTVPLLAFFAAGVLLGLNTVRIEKEHVGAVGEDWALSAGDRVVLAGRLLWFYAWKLALPAGLAFFYPRWAVDAGAAGQWLFPAAAAAALAALFAMRGRIGRGPLAAALLFAGVLFPALGFFDVYPFRYSWAADHFNYLASAPLLALAGAGLVRARAAATARFGPPGRFLPVVVLAPLAVLAWVRCGAFKDAETLWRDTLARNPEAWIAAHNLGVIELGKGRLDEAEALFSRSVALHPRSHEGWNNLGRCRADRGDLRGAEEAVRKAIEVRPDFCQAWTNLGWVLDRRGDLDRGLDAYRKSITFPGTPPEAHHALVRALLDRGLREEALNAARAAGAAFPGDSALAVRLGALLGNAGSWTEAVSILADVVRVEPGNAAARTELARALLAIGEKDRAHAELVEAIRLDPESAAARQMIGVVFQSRGDLKGAEAAWREALRLEPGSVETMASLGGLYAVSGRIPEAHALYAEAVQRAPDAWMVRYGRATLFLSEGRVKEAAAEYREALKRKPDFLPAVNDLAWLLATSRDPAVRTPAEAISLAERLAEATKRNDAWPLRTLAAAYASAGRFDDAIKVVTEAVMLEPPQGVLEDLQEHLKRYRRREAISE